MSYQEDFGKCEQCGESDCDCDCDCESELERVECEGVGDNNGFFEFTSK